MLHEVKENILEMNEHVEILCKERGKNYRTALKI
jgi:hypothetical protein